MTNRTDGCRTLSLILLASVAVSLICVAYPIYVIRPFRHQGMDELAIALVVVRYRPAITVIAALVSVLSLVRYWRETRRWWRRGLATGGAALVIVLAFLARVNIYELMFHPLIQPKFTAAREAKLDGAENVIAVRIGREARSYPIRSMSYHHLVNDVVGNVAIVATY